MERPWRRTSVLSLLLVLPVIGGSFSPPNTASWGLNKVLATRGGGTSTRRKGSVVAFRGGGPGPNASRIQGVSSVTKDNKKLLIEKGGGEPGMTPLTVVRVEPDGPCS